jgi:hypothetical protein
MKGVEGGKKYYFDKKSEKLLQIRRRLPILIVANALFRVYFRKQAVDPFPHQKDSFRIKIQRPTPDVF